MGKSTLSGVLSKLAEVKTNGSGNGKSSGWKAFFLVIGAIILIAIAVVPAILARRKAAKLAHERDVLLEEKRQAEIKAKLEQEGQKRTYLEMAAEDLRKKAEEHQSKINTLTDKRERFKDGVSSITSWDDIPEWGQH